MDWFVAALKKYAVFTGRARRKEYWYFVLFYLLIHAGLSFIQSMLWGTYGTYYYGGHGGILTSFFALVMLVPSLAVGVRRLHDTNRSGWWLLIGMIPIVGAVILIWFMVQDSQPGNNRFGPNPKTMGGPDFGVHERGHML